MKKSLALVILFVIATAAFADPPEYILIKQDTSYVGTYIEDAAYALYPSADVTVIEDTLDGFVTELTGSTDWDLVVLDGFMYGNIGSTSGLVTALTNYYNDGGKLFFSSWSVKNGSETGIISAMGASYVSWLGWSSPLPSHYCWDTSHDLATTPNAISTWTLSDYGIGSSKVTWAIKYGWTTDADPFTGWAASETSNEAAIIVAGDDHGIVAGAFPFCIADDQNEPFMENILTFMWDETIPGIKSASLGEIKAVYK